MSDAIDRDAACKEVCRRCRDGLGIKDGETGDFHREGGMLMRCAASALRSLPAVPTSPAERLARAVAAEEDAIAAARFYPSPPGTFARLEAAWKERAEALAAYRAATPDSTGAAPPAAEPGVTRTRCTIIQTAPTPLQFDAEEPAVEPAPDLPWGTDIGPSDYMTPAAEPAIFQKPPGSCDEGAVRCNNPEPAAQPFRHGRCCAEEPKEPAPCGQCGGSGQVFDSPRVGPFDTKSACPECRPGGAA